MFLKKLFARDKSTSVSSRDALTVEYWAGEIKVSKPGTMFSVTYGKLRSYPWIQLREETTEPKAERQVVLQFVVEAYKAAIRKARDLGWVGSI
jgi:hypothetical protein